MPLLKGNLHAHTTFSDGRRPVDEVVARYRELGYDFLAITDHEDRIGEDYWFRLPAGDGGLLVLHGVEVNFRPLSQHVGRILGDHETLHVLNHPGRYHLSVADVRHRVEVIGRAGLPIHAVEVTETGVYRPEYDVPEIELPKIATDDSHRDEEFGRAWIEVEAPRSADGILRAVKAGDFRLGFPGPGGASRSRPV